MDITLERILSLLPRKPDGKPTHGSKKEFAQKIGFKDGTILADWEAGRSDSYRNYLYEISVKYNVSVEWLKGESNIKENTTCYMGDDISRLFAQLAPENKELVQQLVIQLVKSQQYT